MDAANLTGKFVLEVVQQKFGCGRYTRLTYNLSRHSETGEKSALREILYHCTPTTFGALLVTQVLSDVSVYRASLIRRWPLHWLYGCV